MITLIFSLVGLVGAAIGFGIGGLWGNMLGIFATIVSAGASIRQYKESLPYEQIFTEASWKQVRPSEYELNIPEKVHKKGKKPTVTLFRRDKASTFIEVQGEVKVTQGNITIEVLNILDGKVVVK